MEDAILIASHLSSLFPSSSQINSIPIPTLRRNAPFPSNPENSDILHEHAIHASVSSSAATGPLLVRVIHGGLILEIVPLSSPELVPVRFVFPAVLLASPQVFVVGVNTLHVLAVTETGSLYRIVLSVEPTGQLVTDHLSKGWCREYLIKNVTGTLDGLVHIQGVHCVVIGFKNGSLLRLETDLSDKGDIDDQWTESLSHPGSFLSSLTSLLPSLQNNASNALEILSLASHPQPTDNTNIWSLSRDRVLRLWTARGACVASKTLPETTTGISRSLTPNSDEKTMSLLESERQTLLRVFSLDQESIEAYILAFVPSHSPTYGGIFHLLKIVGDNLVYLGSLESSGNTAHLHLQDFIFLPSQQPSTTFTQSSILYALWDKQGVSVVERIEFDTQDFSRFVPRTDVWLTSTYSDEVELTPTYLEELLLAPGSMADKFLSAITCPGMFSSLTLRTAITQYTEAYLSLPGPPAPQLQATYATVTEHIAGVVGCTVNLLRDNRTGALQYENYWNALKRDWEGFVARCREIERSARWPLALGVDAKGSILIVERERAGLLTTTDLPLRLHRVLVEGLPVDQFPLLDIAWTLKTKLGTQLVLDLERRLIDIVHQEIAFPFADVVQDQARQLNFAAELEEGLESYIHGRLASVKDLDGATHVLLDIIAGVDVPVKTEEDENAALLLTTVAPWKRALTANYISATIHVRYEMSISLLTLLFLLASDLQRWDPGLMTEIFAVFRCVALTKFISRQSAGEIAPRAVSSSVPSADDLVAHMRNMTVSRNERFSPSYSLTYRLLENLRDMPTLHSSAHLFLEGTGLLQSSSPAEVTKFEIMFAERLRLLGYGNIAEDYLSWLPRTPGVIYVFARLRLDQGRADDAAVLFERVAAVFAENSSLSAEDSMALASVLPEALLFESQFTYYLHAAQLFKNASHAQHEIAFTQLALSMTPNGINTSLLWANIVNGYISLSAFNEAYASLISMPYEKIRQDLVGILVTRICDEGAVDRLMSFNFAGLADEAEETLAFKARNANPREQPQYSRMLYTWYTSRGDYRNAALVMYQRAQKIHQLITNAALFAELAEDELEAYLIAINALSLLDVKDAWIVLPLIPGNYHERPQKRRKLSRYIPDDKYALGTHDSQVVELNDMQYEYAILSARIDLVRRDTALLTSGEFLFPPETIVLHLAQANQFTKALSVAHILNVDKSSIYSHLAIQCVRLTRKPDAVLSQDNSDWLLTDNVSSWSGTPADRGWRYLKLSLERYDSPETEFQYSKVVLETILGIDRLSTLPLWLIQSLEKHHPEYLIRTSLQYGLIEHAMEESLKMLREDDARLARANPKHASSTWLPYSLIDQVLAAAAETTSLPAGCEALEKSLRAELLNRAKRMQKLSNLR